VQHFKLCCDVFYRTGQPHYSIAGLTIAAAETSSTHGGD